MEQRSPLSGPHYDMLSRPTIGTNLQFITFHWKQIVLPKVYEIFTESKPLSLPIKLP